MGFVEANLRMESGVFTARISVILVCLSFIQICTMTTSHSRCERTHTDAMAIDPNVNMADFFPAGGQTGRPRSFKKRRRRNRSNFFYLLESAGKISEESDTTDEALRDYMENIAAQQSDSDLDINMARRLSSLR